jgi:hypothetical protein
MVNFLNDNASETVYADYYSSDNYTDPDDEDEEVEDINEDSGFFVMGKP